MDFKIDVTVQADKSFLRRSHRNMFFIFIISGIVILCLSVFLTNYASEWSRKSYDYLPVILINSLLWPFTFLWLSIGIAHGLEWYNPIRPVSERWRRFIKTVGIIGISLYLLPAVVFGILAFTSYFDRFPQSFNLFYLYLFQFLNFLGKQVFYYINIGLCLYFGRKYPHRK